MRLSFLQCYLKYSVYGGYALEIKKIETFKKIRWIILSTITWGIAAHGMALFNKYSYHDDAPLFLIGQTYASGRWMLGFLGEGMKWLTGSTYYSTPLFKGGITLLCIAWIAFLISELLEIENKPLMIGLTGILTVFPVITGMLGYGFTAPYYLFGTLMGVFGGFIVCRYSVWYAYLFGILLMACSVGVYQANIPVCISVLLIYFIKSTVESKESIWRNYIIRMFYYACACVGVVAVYMGISQVVLWHKKISLSDYMGISSYGQMSFRGYLNRIILAYREFFAPTDEVFRNMFPFSLDRFYQAGIAVGILLTGYLVYKRFQKGILFGLQLLILVIFIPLAGNFIYIISDVTQIHSLMMYGQVFLFVYFVWIADFVKLTNRKGKRVVVNFAAVLLGVMGVLYCRFDNICYLKAEYLQSQVISYFTTLVTQIKSTGGYTDETPVVYINGTKKSDTTLPEIPEFKEIFIFPYQFPTLINNYNWRMTMKLWCGFEPQTLDASDYMQMEEVLRMPSYPDTGSIKMMDDVMVVKFAD